METRIDTVLLDAGGVFLLPPPEAVLSIAGVAGEVDPLRHRSAHYAGMRAFDAADGDGRRYVRGFCSGYGIGEPDMDRAAAAFAAALASTPWSVVIEESLQGLRELAATGVTLIVVSNSDGTVEEQLRACSVCQVGAGPGVPVAAILDSHVVGESKPDPRFFRRALAMAGARPRSTVHVGDSIYADVKGARDAGVRPLHFDPEAVCTAQDHDDVRSLSEVAALVRRARPGTD